MTTLTLFKHQHSKVAAQLIKLVLFGIISWLAVPFIIRMYYPTAGLIDPGIVQVILLGLITWALLLTLSIFCLRVVLSKLTLAKGQDIVSQFNFLLPWQQFAFYLAFYALLVFSAIGCLIAIC